MKVTKVCRVCQFSKPITENFIRAVKGMIRTRSVCRSCDNLRRRKRDLANRESEVAATMNWKHNNRQAVAIINARYYKARKARLALLEKN